MNKPGDIVRSTEGKMRRDVIEYVEDNEDDMEDCPDVQMYDTG